jgi:hypothetical protein
MKHLICLAALLVVTTAGHGAYAGEEEIRSCEFEVKARCVSGDARVTLADGVVKRVEVGVFWCGLRGRPGYNCTIDASRTDPDSKWSEEDGATLITNASPANPNQPDRVKVTVGQHVSIDLDEAQSFDRCGVGAELPRAIVIPAQKQACRVWLKAP